MKIQFSKGKQPTQSTPKVSQQNENLTAKIYHNKEKT